MAHSRAQGTKTRSDQHIAETINKTQGEERRFNLVVDGVPYFIKSVPFSFNHELRFHVIINDDTEHVFTWDSELKMLRAIDDDASIIPDRLEEAISEKLQSRLK